MFVNNMVDLLFLSQQTYQMCDGFWMCLYRCKTDTLLVLCFEFYSFFLSTIIYVVFFSKICFDCGLV